MLKFMKQSLLRQFAFIMIILVAFIILGSLGLGVVFYSEQQTFITERDELLDKQSKITEIEEHFTEMLFRGRGYTAFQSEPELEQLYIEAKKLEQVITSLEMSELTSAEAYFIKEITDFTSYYLNELLPQRIVLVEARDYDGLRDLSEQGSTVEINQILSTAHDFANEMDEKINGKNEEFISKLNQVSIIFLLYLLFVLACIGFAIRKVVKEIGYPLQELSKASLQVKAGEHVNFVETDRQDEIGMLSKSFEEMVRSLQMKEEELTAQNEELMAQQDELTGQQEQLHDLLYVSESQKKKLELNNQVISTLSTTLNKHELLREIVTTVSEIFHCDKAMLVLLNDNRDYEVIGVSSKQAETFIHWMNDGVAIKLEQTKKVFVTQRESHSSEQGYHEELSYSYDLFAPIMRADGELIAIYTATRVGQSFLPNELDEHTMIMNQISLSLEKIFLYEEAEQNRLLNQDIIDNVNEGILLVDNDGIIIQINQVFSQVMEVDSVSRLLQLSFDEWVGKLGNVPDEFIRFLTDTLRHQTEAVMTYRYEIHHPKHHVFDIYGQAIFRNGEKIGTLFVQRDITVEHEIDQMKSELVSTVSHELRTPLASILGFTELMITKTLKQDRQAKYLETIHKEAKRLTNLINDFLDLQRMESGNQTYQKESLQVVQVLQQVVDLFQVQHTDRKISIKNEVKEPYVVADEEKLIQLFTNLISNAIKFSPNGGNIDISVDMVDSQLRIAIHDEGLGIPRSEIPNLFQKFYRIDNSDRRKIGGTGLGLAICKEIVQAHHGAISVSSEQGKGSTFTMHFPLAREDRPIANELDSMSDHPKLVILEDDNSLAMLLKEQLNETGFHVIHEKDGEQALQTIEQVKPDAVVIDILLQNSIDGWSVIEILKENPITKDIPIIVSSALDEKERGLGAGAKHYLTKPYPPNQLSTVILQTLVTRKKDGKILLPKETE
ncbi:ATP-binding protein [Alkalihalobacillus sp. LMS39]|uniref:ATP-binding protein n=1 Tax=Alkalihalobacillus sp. LMS39 TaxID=2924032 RepID=UPI001FB35DDD|nr:ATP-binding protein [Alkalihalobacillus sp. LMS39]UOE93112.1 ATP-binding protein [Alkalihalobacillus sp. LMS39]